MLEIPPREIESKWSETDHVLRTFLECTFDEDSLEYSYRAPFYDDSIPVFQPSTLPDLAPILEGATKLCKKRKSEDWDSKPLEKKGTYAIGFANDFISVPEELQAEEELADVADLFFDLQMGASDIDTKGLLHKSASWDWEPEEETSSSTEHVKQKRTKWLKNEVRTLWEGILTHGNNWRAIKHQYLHDRTYYQVKDKGRRILATQGWITGRTKNDTDDASDDAKEIARKVLRDPSRLTASNIAAC